MKYSYNFSKFIVIGVFIMLLVLGFINFRSYGLSWDNTIQRTTGILAYKYIAQKDTTLEHYKDRFYGTGLELPLVLLEKIIRPQTTQQVYYIRYISLYILFWVSLLFYYYFLLKLTSRMWVSLLGVLSVAGYPRIFVDAFTNTKDVGFLSLFVISIGLIALYLHKRSLPVLLFQGVVIGVTIAVRPLGILLVIIGVFVVVYQCFVIVSGKWRNVGIHLSVFLISIVVGILLFWPYLWVDPIRRFITSFSHFSRFPFEGKVLYLGEYIEATKIPWHYIPVWLGITIPLGILLSSVGGLFISVKSLFKAYSIHSLHKKQVLQFIIIFWGIIPLFYIMIFRPVLYDGWRHVYFLYPGIVALSIQFISYWIDKKNNASLIGYALLAGIVLQLSVLTYWSYRTHPHEFVYFNTLAGGMVQAKNNFDLDYWALSYRKCLEYILSQDQRKQIRVYLHYNDPEITDILTPDQKARLIFATTASEADYYISNYRLHKEEYPVSAPPFYTIEIEGTRIAVVYKIASR